MGREQRKPRKGSGVQTLRLDAYITLYVDELAFNDIADKNSVISERGGLMSDIINTSKLLGVCKVNSRAICWNEDIEPPSFRRFASQ